MHSRIIKPRLQLFKTTCFTCSIFLLVLLWTYVAVSKLTNLDAFELQLGKQVYNQQIAGALSYLLPMSEMLIVMLLLCNRYRLSGLLLSSLLMLIFTVYIGLVLLGYSTKHPCSCGGVLQNLGWHAHFYFNLIFLGLSIFGTVVQYKIFKSGGV